MKAHALTSSIDAEVGYSPLIYEVSISDVNGTVLVSSDASLPGKQSPARTNLAQLVSSSFSGQLRALYGPPRAYEVTYPFELGPPGNQVPFGVIRVAVQTGLLRNDITPALRSAALLALASVGISVLLAALVSSVSLAPLKRITAQLDRISKGEFDQKPLERGDEFGQVSTKISQIGMQLRGVREIFSTLRENLDQVLGGLDDGLLLVFPRWPRRHGQPRRRAISVHAGGPASGAPRGRYFSARPSGARSHQTGGRRIRAGRSCRGRSGRAGFAGAARGR